MEKVKDITKFLLSLDKEHGLFNDTELMEMNGRSFYKGNARLNKYIHLAQNIFYAKTSGLLFSEALYAYDNGGVVPEIQENYKYIIKNNDTACDDISEEKKVFLKKLYKVLLNAPLDKLIELSHQDPEWIKKHSFFSKEEQRMNTKANLSEYKKQYADIIKIMDGMEAEELNGSDETIAAVTEARLISENPNLAKSYSDVDEMMEDILSEV